jgi:hypothetical protein
MSDDLEKCLRPVDTVMPPFEAKCITLWGLRLQFDPFVKLEFHGAKVVRHAKYVTFQLAEVAISRSLFAMILDKIAQLRMEPETG